MSATYDIAVVGSGFAGSLLAMIAHRLGRSVILIEKGTHPRVVIGESSTPLSNLLLEELTSRYGLASIGPLAKWGSWQRSYPHVGCGLKRGFTFHHHVLGSTAEPDPERRNQLLVAASPRDEISDTHWYRADFDHLLVQEAVKLGVEYVDQVKLHRMTDCGDAVRLEGKQSGKDVEFHARFVVDATGPRGFIHQALGLNETEFAGYPHKMCIRDSSWESASFATRRPAVRSRSAPPTLHPKRARSLLYSLLETNAPRVCLFRQGLEILFSPRCLKVNLPMDGLNHRSR